MMKKERFLNFEQFILEESCTQRTSAISTAVSKIKEEFGDTKEKFLKSAEEKGVDDIKDFIEKLLNLILRGSRDRRRFRRVRSSY